MISAVNIDPGRHSQRVHQLNGLADFARIGERLFAVRQCGIRVAAQPQGQRLRKDKMDTRTSGQIVPADDAGTIVKRHRAIEMFLGL